MPSVVVPLNCGVCDRTASLLLKAWEAAGGMVAPEINGKRLSSWLMSTPKSRHKGVSNPSCKRVVYSGLTTPKTPVGAFLKSSYWVMNEVLMTPPEARPLTTLVLKVAAWPVVKELSPCCRLSVLLQFIAVVHSASNRARELSILALAMAGYRASTRTRSLSLLSEAYVPWAEFGKLTS